MKIPGGCDEGKDRRGIMTIFRATTRVRQKAGVCPGRTTRGRSADAAPTPRAAGRDHIAGGPNSVITRATTEWSFARRNRSRSTCCRSAATTSGAPRRPRRTGRRRCGSCATRRWSSSAKPPERTCSGEGRSARRSRHAVLARLLRVRPQRSQPVVRTPRRTDHRRVRVPATPGTCTANGVAIPRHMIQVRRGPQRCRQAVRVLGRLPGGRDRPCPTGRKRPTVAVAFHFADRGNRMASRTVAFGR